MGALTKVAIFENSKSQHDVLRHFTSSLRRAFSNIGIKSITFDILEQSPTEILAMLVKEQVDCSLGFNVVVPEDLFFNVTQAPHVALIVDSATYYPELEHCPHSIATFAEEDSLQFMRLHNLPYTLYLPHAIDANLASEEKEGIVLRSQRDLDIVFAGSFIDPDAPYRLLKEYLEKPCITELDSIIEETLTDPNKSHLLRIIQLFERKESFAAQVFTSPIPPADIFNLVELIIRGRDRIRLLQNITEHNVHIVGAPQDESLWKAVLPRNKEVQFHKSVPYGDLFNLFLRSKIVLNSTPTIKRGYHERIFLAAAAGATVVTNSSSYTGHYPLVPPAVVTYTPLEYTKLNHLIHTICAEDDKRLQAVTAFRREIHINHTWDVRAKELALKLPAMISAIGEKKKRLDIELL